MLTVEGTQPFIPPTSSFFALGFGQSCASEGAIQKHPSFELSGATSMMLRLEAGALFNAASGVRAWRR